MVQLNLKIVSNKELYHLKFMLILNVIQKKLMLMVETKTLRILKNTKIIFLVALLTNLYVMMINLADQLFFTEKKIQFIN